MITSKDLAKLAGVSQSTVSRALNNSPLVSDETKEKVKELAQKHNFMFNYSAQSLKSKKTGFIGYVFSENFQSFIQNVAQGHLFRSMAKMLKEQGLDIIPIFHGNDDVIAYIRHRKVDGLIINRVYLDEELVLLLDKQKIPYILVHDADEYSTYPYVVSLNNYKSGHIVGEAFAEKGYTKLVEVCGYEDRRDVIGKHAGFAAAIGKKGIKLDENSVFYSDYTFEGGYQTTLSNIDAFKKAQACFAHNDTMALGVIEALKEQGIRVPEDVAIIGHDNVPMTTWFTPRLSTIAINYERFSKITTDWMVELLNGNSGDEFKKITVNGELIIRDTFK